METVLALKPLTKHPLEAVWRSMSFAELLGAGETISSVLSVAVSPTGTDSDVTVTGQAPNAETLTDDEGNSIAPGLAVVFYLQGGTAGFDYRITVKVQTQINASNVNQPVGVGVLKIKDGLP